MPSIKKIMPTKKQLRQRQLLNKVFMKVYECNRIIVDGYLSYSQLERKNALLNKLGNPCTSPENAKRIRRKIRYIKLHGAYLFMLGSNRPLSYIRQFLTKKEFKEYEGLCRINPN